MREASFYIKGSGPKWYKLDPVERGTEEHALVKIEVDDNWPANIKAALAREEAIERGCNPSGTCIVYEVEPQDESFYNKLWTEEDANNPVLRALAR